MIGLNEDVTFGEGYEDMTQDEMDELMEDLNEYPNVLGCVLIGSCDQLGAAFVKNDATAEVLDRLKQLVEAIENGMKEGDFDEQS